MLEYKVARDKRHSVPIFEFEDKSYALLGEFLLAECRNFGPELISFLEKHGGQREEFAGNVFRVEAAGSHAKVVNDLTDKECMMKVEDLQSVVRAYMEQVNSGK